MIRRMACIVLLFLFMLVYRQYWKEIQCVRNVKNKIVFGVFQLIMLFQIVAGIVWSVYNFDFIPEFGDTGEYYMLSQTLKRDPIRTIFYPLIIRVASIIETHIGIPYMMIIYVFQILFAGGCIYYFMKVLNSYIHTNWGKYTLIVYSLFILSIPQVMGFHMAVLADSLAFSFLVLMSAIGVKWIENGVLDKWQTILFILTFFCNASLRYERKVFSMVYIIILFVCVSIFHRENWKRNVLNTLCILLFSYLLIGILQMVTPFGNDMERHEENSALIVFARVCRGNLAENYESLPEAFKSIITYDEVVVFDCGGRTGDVLTKIENVIGVDEGKALAFDISYSILKKTWRKLLFGMIKDCVLYANPFLYALIEYNIVHVGGMDWNYSRFIQHTPFLSKLYYNLSLYLNTLILFLMSMVLIWKEKNVLKDIVKPLCSPILVSVLLVGLWGVVNNSLPNDRYVLYLYMIWYLVIILQSEELFLKNSIN